MRAQDAGHEVGVAELEQQPVEADREQDEGDVRVGEQVQERLERVHAARPAAGAPSRLERHRLAVDAHGPAVGQGDRVLERVGDAVDGAGGDRLIDRV